MAKERVSKLQRFILVKGYEDCGVMRRHFLEYYGLYDTGTGRKKALGNTNRVTMLRCKKAMFTNGLIEKRGINTCLTEKGVNILKANDFIDSKRNISFKDYEQRVKEWEIQGKKFVEQLKLMVKTFKR